MRYVPILRPANEQGNIVRAALLGEGIELRIHWDNGAFPCLGAECRFATNGRCVRQAKIKHYAPAQRCTSTEIVPAAEELQAYRRAVADWTERHGSRDSRPVPPAPRKSHTPAVPVSLGIAEISDTSIDIFPEEYRGVIFTLRKNGARLEYAVVDAVRPELLAPPFNVAPFLERIFGQPIFPQEVEENAEMPDVIKFPMRKQA